MTRSRRRAGAPAPLAVVPVGMATVLLLLCQLVWGTSAASAHSDLAWSSPGNGSTVSTPPSQVVLEFVDPVNLDLSQVVVTRPDGSQSRVVDLDLARSGELVATLAPGGPRGSWRVDYRTVSEDSHVVTGRIDFGVDAPPVTPAVSRLRWAVGLGGFAVVLIVLVHLRRASLESATRVRVPAEVD